MDELSAYEQLRLENIRQNEKELSRLFGEEQVQMGKRQQEQEQHKSKPKKKVKKEHQEGSRRSTRIRNIGTKKLEAGPPQLMKEERPPPVVVERPNYEALREQLMSAFEGDMGKQDVGEDEWRQQAVETWGDKVLQAAGFENGTKIDWKKYVLSRRTIKGEHPVESPLGLLQERYADDPWRLLIACCLMSRVSSAKTKETCIEGFFALCPSPSVTVDTPANEIENVIMPLGLFQNRYRSILELSKAFLLMPEFCIDLEMNKVYGFGEFAFDSYLLFAKGLAAFTTPKDKNLQAYAAWAKKYVAQNAH